MADDDPKYLAWLRMQPCAVCGRHPVQVHHHTHRRTYGVRASDRDGIPLCWQHHQAFHHAVGPFFGWLREQRTAWQDEAVARLREAYSALQDESVF